MVTYGAVERLEDMHSDRLNRMKREQRRSMQVYSTFLYVVGNSTHFAWI